LRYIRYLASKGKQATLSETVSVIATNWSSQLIGHGFLADGLATAKPRTCRHVERPFYIAFSVSIISKKNLMVPIVGTLINWFE